MYYKTIYLFILNIIIPIRTYIIPGGALVLQHNFMRHYFNIIYCGDTETDTREHNLRPYTQCSSIYRYTFRHLP